MRDVSEDRLTIENRVVEARYEIQRISENNSVMRDPIHTARESF